jgi:hypothetical protein
MEKRILAAIFLILSFIFALAGAAGLLFAGEEASSLPMMGETFETILYICGAIELIFGLLALLGAIMCFKGTGWGIALVGGIFGLLSIGMFGAGSLFGLLGLIFVAISKDEFNGGAAPVAAPPPAYGAPPPGYPPAQQPPMEQPPAQPPMEQPPAQPPAEPPAEQPPAEPPQY